MPRRSHWSLALPTPRCWLRLSLRLDPVRPHADAAAPARGDIRSIGSGNIGATNVLRTGSKALAAAHAPRRCPQGHRCGARGPLRSSARMPRSRPRLGAFLGHIFPVWLRFKGGKGVATYIGLLIGARLAGRARLLPDLARGRRAHPLLLARRPRRQRRHARRCCGSSHDAAHGAAVRAAHRAAVDHAPAPTSRGSSPAPSPRSAARRPPPEAESARLNSDCRRPARRQFWADRDRGAA